VKCVAWNFDGSNYVGWDEKKKNFKKLSFENRDSIPNIEIYFTE
jgi:hypothetical protein